MDQPTSSPAGPAGLAALPGMQQSFDPAMFGQMLLNRQAPTYLPTPQAQATPPAGPPAALQLLAALQQRGAATAAQRIGAASTAQSGKGAPGQSGKGGDSPLGRLIQQQLPSGTAPTQNTGSLPPAYLQR